MSSKNMIINCEVILNPTFEEILSSIEKEEKKYNSKFTFGVFKQNVIKTKDDFLDDFKNQKIPQLVDAIHQTQIPETLENYINNIDSANNKVSERHNIVKFQKNGGLPPKSKTYSIALQELIKHEIIQPYSKIYNNHISEAKGRINSIIRSLTEINHLYELNWDSANTLIKNSNGNGEFEEALSIIKMSFKRSREIIEKLWQESKNSLVFSKELLIKKSQELYTGYQSLTNADQLIVFNLKLRRDKNQIHIQNVLKKLYDFIIFIFFDSIKNLFYKITSILHLKRLIKKKTFTTVEEILVNYSKYARLKLSNIPTVYQRLFLGEPESDDRFFFERKIETEKITKVYKKWQKGDDVLSVLIGEKGAGKTSILNFAEKNIFKDHNVLRINFDSNCVNEQELLSTLKNSFQYKNVGSWENLENKIVNSVNSQVVILDNLHHLFLKNPNGFDTLKRFLLFLQHTRHVVYWLLSCSYYSWVFLDKILNISQYINSTIYIEQLSPEQLKSIILERHKISGYKLMFEADETEKNLKKYKKLQTEKKQQNYLNDRFFDELNNIYRGNFTTAFQYWLTSIKEFNNDNIYLNPISIIESNLLEQLNQYDLFTLVPFIQHDGLSGDESVVIMRKLKHQNMLTLNRLVSYGLLEKKDNYYKINPLYYTFILNSLMSKNLIFQDDKVENRLIKSSPIDLDSSVKIDLYLPVKTDTLLASKIAFQSTAVSKYVDLTKDISVNFINKVYDGISVLNMQIQACIFNSSYKDMFVSEVTEMIFKELMKQNIITQNDFYI